MAPPKCNNNGLLICLNSAICNETSGVCESCNLNYFAHDEVSLLGNKNCGISIIAIYIIYLVTSFFSLTVCFQSFRLQQQTSKASFKQLLRVICVWTFTVPFYMLSHYLEGFKHGQASICMLTLILILVNYHIFLYTYLWETFIGMICNLTHEKIASLQHNIIIWNIFCFSFKFIGWVITLYGLSVNDIDLYNDGYMFLMLCLLTEVSVNTLRVYLCNKKLIRLVFYQSQNTQSSSTVMNNLNSNNPLKMEIIEFVMRVKNQMYIMPIYALIVFLIMIAYFALFLVYESAIPYYSFIVWAVNLLCWPLIGLKPVIVFKSNLGKQMSRQNQNNDIGNSSLTRVKGDIVIHDEENKNSSDPNQPPQYITTPAGW